MRLITQQDHSKDERQIVVILWRKRWRAATTIPAAHWIQVTFFVHNWRSKLSRSLRNCHLCTSSKRMWPPKIELISKCWPLLEVDDSRVWKFWPLRHTTCMPRRKLLSSSFAHFCCHFFGYHFNFLPFCFSLLFCCFLKMTPLGLNSDMLRFLSYSLGASSSFHSRAKDRKNSTWPHFLYLLSNGLMCVKIQTGILHKKSLLKSNFFVFNSMCLARDKSFLYLFWSHGNFKYMGMKKIWLS